MLFILCSNHAKRFTKFPEPDPSKVAYICTCNVCRGELKCNLLGEKDELYMFVLLASPRWLWCPGEYLLVSYSMIFCMEPEYIPQDISATWEKLIKPTYRAHLFHQVSITLIYSYPDGKAYIHPGPTNELFVRILL